MVVKNWKCPNDRNWPWTLTSKSTLCARKTYGVTLKLKFWSVSLYSHLFSRYKVAENRKWPQIEFEHLTVKSSLYTLNTYLTSPKFAPSCSAISRFWGTRSPKSEMHRMTPNWTFNSQKYSVHTKYLSLRSKVWSVSLYDQRFLDDGGTTDLVMPSWRQ